MTLFRACCLLLLLGVASPGLAQTCPPGHPRVAPNDRYSITEPVTSSGEFVVTDTRTGLMWKQCSEGQSGATCVGTATTHTWTAALTLANASTHAGFNDWRLPNREELRSLVETGCHSPSINLTAFPATGSVAYWSSTTYASSASLAWSVNFSVGGLLGSSKISFLRIRLVRGGQWFDTFSAEADGEPQGFSLAAQSGVALSSVRTSDAISVAGLTTVTGIGVSGASDSTYSINGGAYTSQPGALANGDEVRVRHTSAATPGTATTTTLNIGGVTADFVTTTADVPGAPTIGSATAGNASATVTFTAPGSDGGSAITGYTAVSSPAGGTSDCSIAELSCTVTDLTNGTAYTFTVIATNAVGDSAASAASNSVTPATVPDAPMIGTATAGNGSATVTFTAPGSDGGSPITGYTAVSSPTGGSSDCSIPEISCTVTDLDNGTAYTFTVIATNAVGPGSASAPSNSVTPKAPQAIAFGSAPTVVVDGTGTVSATGGGSGNPVVFSSQSTGVCTVSGTNGATVTGVSVGTCTIAANQAGNGSFTDAPEQTQSFAVGQGSQTISFGPLANKLDNDPPFSVSATGGNSPLPVTFASQTEPVCTTSGTNGSTVTLTGELGTCTIRASQAGNVNYAAATPVDQSFEVTASNQPPTISLPASLVILEDGTGSVSITVGDDQTPAAELTLQASSDNAALISDSALDTGLGGSGSTRTLSLTPAANENGSAVITVTVTDGNAATAQAQLTLTVTPVNDPPSAAFGQNEVWPAGESGEKTATGFVSLTSAGPGNESGQTVSADVAIDSDPDSVLSAASIQPNGDLTYTLTGNSGAARIRLQAVDDGGTANGGIDRGDVVTRRIIVGDGVDISLSIRRGQPAGKLSDALAKGATMAGYTVAVTNNSAQDANGLRIQVSPIIGLTDVLWNCVITACTPPNGNGGIDTTADLQAGGVLLIGLTGRVDTNVHFVEITASATLPQGTTVVLRDDDDQVFIEPSGSTGVYKSGFE